MRYPSNEPARIPTPASGRPVRMPDEAHQLHCRRVVTAPVEEVWRAWTDEDLMVDWFCPDPSFTSQVSADARPGGVYSVEMGQGFIVAGVFTRLDEPRGLEFSWHWEHESRVPASMVHVSFTPVAEGTLVEIEHGGFVLPDDAEGHREGWMRSLHRLGLLLDRPAN